MYLYHPLAPAIRRSALLGVLWFTLPAPFATPALAQAVGYQPLPPETALARMAAGDLSPFAIVAAFEEDRVQDGVTRRGNRDSYTDADRTLLLDGIEELITTNPPSFDRGVSYGFTAFVGIAMGLWESAPEAREIPGRLLRIYEGTDSGDVQARAIVYLASILPLEPSESAAITELLVTIASQPASQLGRPAPVDGVRALMVACEPGASALQSLLDESAITEPLARGMAEGYSARGFPEDEVMRLGPCPTP